MKADNYQTSPKHWIS